MIFGVGEGIATAGVSFSVAWTVVKLFRKNGYVNTEICSERHNSLNRRLDEMAIDVREIKKLLMSQRTTNRVKGSN
jgi:hypothetical protein